MHGLIPTLQKSLSIVKLVGLQTNVSLEKTISDIVVYENSNYQYHVLLVSELF